MIIDSSFLMTSRLRLFSGLDIKKPAIYLDTDMLVVKHIEPSILLGNRSVLVCRREFDRLALFNTEMKEEVFEEYDSQPLGTVFPFLACTTVTHSSDFWEHCSAQLDSLPAKFHRWYGDQEAMKRVIEKVAPEKVGYLNESVYGCLPDFIDKGRIDPVILHFKGHYRKAAMVKHHASLMAQKAQSIGSKAKSGDTEVANKSDFVSANEGYFVRDAVQISVFEYAKSHCESLIIHSEPGRVVCQAARSPIPGKEFPFKIGSSHVFTVKLRDLTLVKRKYFHSAPHNYLLTTGLTHSDYALTWPGFDISGTGIGKKAVEELVKVTLDAGTPEVVDSPGIFIGGDTISEVNFAHWIFEHLLKFYALSKSHVDWSLPVYVSSRLPVRFYDWVEPLIGFRPNFKPLDLDRAINFSSIFVSSCPAYRDVKGNPTLWWEGFDYLRHKLLSQSLLNLRSNRGVTKTAFLSRRRANWRRAVNEDELYEIARNSLSAERLELSALSPIEQVGAVAQLDILILFGGADGAITNFLPSRGIVVEIVAPNHTALYTSLIFCVHHSIRYVRLKGENSVGEISGPHPLDKDYYVDPNKFKNLLMSLSKILEIDS